MIARCVDAEGVTELTYGWDYEIHPMPGHCVRVLVGDSEWIICAASRFRPTVVRLTLVTP